MRSFYALLACVFLWGSGFLAAVGELGWGVALFTLWVGMVALCVNEKEGA